MPSFSAQSGAAHSLRAELVSRAGANESSLRGHTEQQEQQSASVRKFGDEQLELQNAFSGAEQRMEELTRRLDVPGGRRWGRSSRSPLMRVDEDWERKALATPAIPDVAPMSRSPSDGTVSTISTEWLDAWLQHDLHKSCPQICWELPCLRKMVLVRSSASKPADRCSHC